MLASGPARPAAGRVTRLLNVAIAGAALLLLSVLATGGYTVAGVRLRKLAPLVVVLCGLLVLKCWPSRRSPLSMAVLLGAGALLVYMSPFKVPASVGDTAPARYLPLSILRQGNFDLDEFPGLHGGALPHFLHKVCGHYTSAYPVGAAIAALPLYAPAVFAPLSPGAPFLAELEKFAAAALTAASVALLYLTLLRLVSPRFAVVIALVYAFGSSNLSTSSQALWQHGPGALALTAALYCLVRGRADPRWVGLAGFPLAFAVVCRPTNVLVVLPLLVFVLARFPRQLPVLILTALPWAAFQVAYNAVYYGNTLWTQFEATGSGWWSTPLGTGLAGILFSPSRGLFLYSPVFILAAWGTWLAWRPRGDRLLRALSVGAMLAVIVCAKWGAWWGGHSFGPRLLADLTPLFAVLLCPLEAALTRRRALRALFGLLAGVSMVIHFTGALTGAHAWNAAVDVDQFPHRLWSWTDNQIVNPFVDLATVARISWQRWPTSRTVPQLVAGSYRLHGSNAVVANAVARPGQPLRVAVVATNTGRAVWVPRPNRVPGIVRLGARWIGGPPAPLDSVPLHRYVFPGQAYEAAISVSAPRVPGQYVLEIDLVSEERGPFSALGTVPLRLPVRVEGEVLAPPTETTDSRVGRCR